MPKPVSFTKYQQYIKLFDSEYEKLPILTSISSKSPEILCCWRFNLWERIKLLFQGEILVRVLDSSMPLVKISQDFSHVREIEKFYLKVTTEDEFKRKLVSEEEFIEINFEN